MTPVSNMRGWHRVRFAPGAKLLYYHPMNGVEWMGDDPPPEEYVGSSVAIVPTQRVRVPKSRTT